MSEATNPVGPSAPSAGTPGTMAAPMRTADTLSAAEAQPLPGVARRPGMVTFAAIMLFVAGGIELIWAITEFANAAWIAANVYGTFGGWLWLWGILDTFFALVLFYAGYDILRGGSFGRILGIVVAAVSAVRWFFYIPAAPWLAITVIALDALVIYALTAHPEFFQADYLG